MWYCFVFLLFPSFHPSRALQDGAGIHSWTQRDVQSFRTMPTVGWGAKMNSCNIGRTDQEQDWHRLRNDHDADVADIQVGEIMYSVFGNIIATCNLFAGQDMRRVMERNFPRHLTCASTASHILCLKSCISAHPTPKRLSSMMTMMRTVLTCAVSCYHPASASWRKSMAIDASTMLYHVLSCSEG